MPLITLPDGSQRRFDEPVSVAEVAADIGPGLAKAALAGRVGQQLVDTAFVIDADADVETEPVTTLATVTPAPPVAPQMPVRSPSRIAWSVMLLVLVASVAFNVVLWINAQNAATQKQQLLDQQPAQTAATRGRRARNPASWIDTGI